MLKRLAILILIAGCGAVSAPEKVARNFIQSYYVETNLRKAAADCAGLALDKIQNSLKLVEGQGIDAGTRHPKIFFDLVKGETDGDEATYLFKITIRPPDFQEIITRTRVKVRQRDGHWKVTQFSDYDENNF